MKLANWRLPLASAIGLLGAVSLLVPQAASASAAPDSHSAPLAVAGNGLPCSDTQVGSSGFMRCTSPSVDGTWASVGCTANRNYNILTGTPPFNVYAAANACGFRVWLHQYGYPRDTDQGWSYCIPPHGFVNSVPSFAVNPDNIFVSDNPAPC